jgi:hypothetical protein
MPNGYKAARAKSLEASALIVSGAEEAQSAISRGDYRAAAEFYQRLSASIYAATQGCVLMVRAKAEEN